MDDTPYIHDGADASLRKTVSLLNKIEAKTGSPTITGPVTVSNEVEVTNESGNPIPVSGTVGISGTVPVSGTFWQATQPVSGSVSVSNFPATQAVSGTVTANTGLSQPLTDTQLRATAVPVSGPLTDTELRASAVPVSGTFWQATQPVSLASAISQKVQGWDIPIHDYRGLGYTSGNLTSVTYKTGGSSGTTVATLTLGYDGSGNLTSVTKT